MSSRGFALAALVWLAAAAGASGQQPRAEVPASAERATAGSPATAEGTVSGGAAVSSDARALLPVIVAPALVQGNHHLADLAEYGALQQGSRQTWRFARYGALAGGAAGLLVGGWFALYCSGTNTGDNCLGGLLIFTGLGAASGFLAGAIIGAAVPASGEAAPPTPARPAEPRPATERAGAPGAIASGGIAAGVARASIGDEDGTARTRSGPTGRLTVYAELRPWLGLGPDLGVASFDDAGAVRHIAVATRFRSTGGRISPFATVNLGAYQSTGPSLEYLGGGLGVGARLEPLPGRRFFIDVEGRHSRNAQNIAPMRLNALTVSGGYYW